MPTATTAFAPSCAMCWRSPTRRSRAIATSWSASTSTPGAVSRSTGRRRRFFRQAVLPVTGQRVHRAADPYSLQAGVVRRRPRGGLRDRRLPGSPLHDACGFRRTAATRRRLQAGEEQRGQDGTAPAHGIVRGQVPRFRVGGRYRSGFPGRNHAQGNHAADLRPVGEMPSALASQKLEEMLRIRNMSGNSGSTTMVARLTHARLYGTEAPYEHRSPEEIMGELAEIRSKFRNQDSQFPVPGSRNRGTAARDLQPGRGNTQRCVADDHPPESQFILRGGHPAETLRQ